MNSTRTRAQEDGDAFINLVVFKWLMAHVGWRVNLSRLQGDRAYTEECLQRALKCDSQFLREHSIELLSPLFGPNPCYDAAYSGAAGPSAR